ncbi:MarR family winged helix-turn-helix transcriptional regulator [Actinoallomurus soli]|uniref:MarR family winged helix-turn-helix transcriptional regulator n=1 Tax=Actinoallomurus soli TaxID=2952535 RepID=UPI0020928C07|nr:MarR family winged helix-turn-helix transcriptional regulator [Actinoallomurus soli]MCO5974017.1 MarR family winged helix-turn-helix transcriptional regulator [Actinoallomurus soli]
MTTSGTPPEMPLGEPDELENALSHLQCVLVARRALTNPEGVTWQQYDVLELLRIRGPMMPSALSTALGVSRQTISKALRVLKDLGLVGQETAGADRRELTTFLTAEGRSFLARVAHQRRENARTVTAALTPAERALFTELCAKATAAIEALSGDGASLRAASSAPSP